MNSFNPDTYCGIYCGACSIAMHEQTGVTDTFAACLGGVPQKDLACGGCKSDRVYHGCRLCALRSCARHKKVEHCIDCSDYPCKTYRTWLKAAKALPHLEDAGTGLKAIKRNGVAHWLNFQKKAWSCPSCGTPFSWYAAQCSKCDHSLEARAFRLYGWRRIVCRFMLQVAYRKGKAKQ